MSTPGTVDWNLPANAGDMGSVLGLGRFPMPEQLNPHAAASEPACYNY